MAKSDILDGIIALLVALLILSVIAEKAVTLIRSYLKQFRLLAIFSSCYLLIGLWFHSDMLTSKNDFLQYLIFFGWIVFHFFLYILYNFGYQKLWLKKNNQRVMYVVNGSLMIVFYFLCYRANISIYPRHFLWWNALLFTSLLLLVQSLLHKELFMAVGKGKVAEKTEKEIEISFFSICIGTLIAFFFHANFFKIIKIALTANANMSQVFSWGIDSSYPFIFDGTFAKFSSAFNLTAYDLLGIVITGFFLSYGSKFFHDTLEYLIEIRNLKKTMVDKESYKPERIQDVDEMMKISWGTVAREVKKKYEDELRALYPNIVSINNGISIIDGQRKDSLIIHIHDSNDLEIPKSLPFELSTGKTLYVPIELVKDVNVGTTQQRPGVKLACVKDLSKVGTFGCVVKSIKSDATYILTCSHVAFSGSSKDYAGVINDSTYSFRQIGMGKQKTISTEVYYARRDGSNDTALLLPMQEYSNDVDGVRIKAARELDMVADLLSEVCFFGSTSGFTGGKIHLVSNADKDYFKYDDGITIDYTGLIVFGKLIGDQWRPVTLPGDSGSVLLDKNKAAIGLIIGANSRFSYALPLKKILDQAKCTIAK